MSDSGPRPPATKLDLSAYLPGDVEEVLAYRLVKRSMGILGAVIGLVAAVFSYAGYDVLKHLNDSKRALEEQTRLTQVAAMAQRDHFDRQSAELTRLVKEMNESVQRVRGQSDAYQREFERNLTKMGEQDSKFINSITQTERLGSSVQARLDALEKIQKDMETQKVSVDTSVSGMSARVEGIESFILNSGSFVVKERTQAQELHGMNLTVGLGQVRDRLLRSFTVCCRGDGRPAWGPKDLLQGTEITFDANDTRYALRPTYVLEYLGRDAVGLDVKRISRPSSEVALKGDSH